MRRYRMLSTAIAIGACFAIGVAAAGAPARPSSTPAAAAPTAAPSPSFIPIPPQSCDRPISIGEVTLCSDEFNYNFKTGDVQFPSALHGRTAEGSYRADRGYGNLHSEVINLVGHVMIHRDPTKDKTGKPVEAMTLTSDLATVESKAKYYRASGNVKIVQGTLSLAAPLVVDDESKRMVDASGGVIVMKGDRTMTAPQMTLDEASHVAHLTGGVHAEEKPDKSFDATEVFYNTQTQDFKALGTVHMQFPANSPAPSVSATASPSPGATSSASPTPSPTP